jgi:hypothetical protein
MSVHLLIERSHRFQTSQPAFSSGWVYCRNIGAWVEDGDRQSLMANPKPRPTPGPPPRPRPVSKKNDVETGEDMKGT